MKVLKFSGSSLEDSNRIESVTHLIRKNCRQGPVAVPLVECGRRSDMQTGPSSNRAKLAGETSRSRGLSATGSFADIDCGL